MIIPRAVTKSLLAVTLLAIVLLSGGAPFEAHAQQPSPAADDTSRGIELYNQGDDKGAIETLARAIKLDKYDVAGWRYLGLAYARQGKTDDARKAHERAVRGGEKLLVQLYSSRSFQAVLSASSRLRSLLTMAADSATKYLELDSKPSRAKVEEWKQREEILRDYVDLYEKSGGDASVLRIYQPREVETKARIISRPVPALSGGGQTGRIVLRAVLAFDGKVRGVIIVSGFEESLDREAVKAARQMQFIPATIKSKPVSQFLQIEYNFGVR